MTSNSSIPAGFGQDILLEVTKYLDPVDYSAVNKLLYRVAEERADALLKKTEERCFGSANSDWWSAAGKTKWKLRMGLSVVESFPNKSNQDTNKNTSRKRKRDITAENEGLDQQDSISKKHTHPINPMASRILWNRASRVPLASTQGSFKGPSAMLPDGRHIAFFCPEYLHIVIVDCDASADNGRIVHVIDVQDIVPTTSLYADLRLFCSKGGDLVLYCSQQTDGNACHDTQIANHTEEPATSTSLDAKISESQQIPPPSPKRRKSNGIRKLSNNASFPGNDSVCWISAWKITPSTENPFALEHKYTRRLDTVPDSTHSGQSSQLLPTVQEVTMSQSSGTIILMRYGQDDASSDSDTNCWIQSFSMSSGAIIATKRISQYQERQSSFGWIKNCQLSVPEDGAHVLVTLDGSPKSNPGATTLRHYSIDKQSLELVDINEVSPSQLSKDCRNFVQEHFDDEADDEEEDVDCCYDFFAQHAERRVLHFLSNRRYFYSDPTSVASTGYNLLLNPNGKFCVQEPPTHQKPHLKKRWKLTHAFEDKPTALFENPDEEFIFLDEVNLDTGEKLRSISTGLSRLNSQSLGYSIEAVHTDRGHRHGGDMFLALTSNLELNSSGGSTVLLRFLPRAS